MQPHLGSVVWCLANTTWLGSKFFRAFTLLVVKVYVGEFRKTRHPRNVEFNEVLKACFSGAGNSRFSEVWDLRSLEFANVQNSGILVRQEEESRACGSPESQLLIVRTSEELMIREPDED
jgi:hypothetical protein